MLSNRSDRGVPRGAGTAAFAAAVLAAGCPSSDDDGASAEEREVETSPREGGHLVLPSNEPRFLNPLLETRFERANDLIFEGLVGLDNQLEAVPRLAESWEVTEDGTEIEFALREDVTWHDGEPLTSGDVAFTLEALEETDAQTVWRTYMDEVEALETPDEHTVVVRYDEPYAPALKTWTMGIVPEHIYGDADDIADAGANHEPVGTGPYRLGRWERGERMVLSANEDWWYEAEGEDGAEAGAAPGAEGGEEGGEGRPYIDSIELLFGVENQLEALENHEIDFADVANVGAWRQTQVGDFRERFEVSSVVENEFWAIGWNTQRAPFDDAEVRIALTHALDRGRVIDDVLLGQAQPLSAPFFPAMFGDDPSIAPYPFDLDEAAAKLDAAGQPERNGERFEIEMIMLEPPGPAPADEALAIFRRDLAEIGIDLTVDRLSTQQFFDRTVLFEYDAVYFGWVPDVPDPDPSILLHSNQIGAGHNFAALGDGEVDDLLEEARRRTSRGERAEVYRELHERLHELEPYTMLYAPHGHYAWNRRVRGVNPADAGPQPPFPGLARWFVIPAEEATAAVDLGEPPAP